MKWLFALGLACFFFAGPARADLTIVQEVTSKASQDSKTEVTLYLADGKSRIEQTQGGVIFLAAEKKNIILSHPDKSYMVMPASLGGSMIEGVASADQSKEKQLSWKATGKKETIAGYEAEQWVGQADGKTKVEIWVGGKPELVTQSIEKLSNLGGALSKIADDFRSKKEAGPYARGYPLKTIDYDDAGQPVGTMVVKKIDEGSISPDVFHVPPGYTETKLPEMPNGAGAPGVPSPDPAPPATSSNAEPFRGGPWEAPDWAKPYSK